MHTVAVIEDNPDNSAMLKIVLEDAGLTPLIFYDGFGNLKELVNALKGKVQGAICDHRLNYRNYAPFEGAEAVARLYDESVPAVLVTQFRKIDADVSIRKWRHKVPVLLPRSDVDPESVLGGLASCASEIKGMIPQHRIPRRSLVKVVGISQESNCNVVDAIIPQWNPSEAVRFPDVLLPQRLRDSLDVGVAYIAGVNIDAENSEDLFLCDFELVPNPNPDDGLS